MDIFNKATLAKLIADTGNTKAHTALNKALDGATPEQLHDAWCEFQKADGWVLGETKDVVAKTHPCLVQYDQLPAEQRNKDQFFIAVVESLQPLL